MKRAVSVLSLLVFSLLLATGCRDNADLKNNTFRQNKIDTYRRGVYRIELSYPDPAEDLTFGSTIELGLRIEYPAGRNFILLPPDLSSAERYANTVITSVEQKDSYIEGDLAVSEIIFSVEAWLPGPLVFPPLTVRFDESVTTEEVIFNIASAFDGDEEEHSLSPIYFPEQGTAADGRIIVFSAAGAIVAAAAVVTSVVVRRKRKKRNGSQTIKTRAEEIDEFRRMYIDTDEAPDFRKGFAEIVRLSDDSLIAEYRDFIETARFSKEGVGIAEGRKVITELYGKLVSEAVDDL